MAWLPVSVAGCLGYDVLVLLITLFPSMLVVSVAGCLGYDVLGRYHHQGILDAEFQLLVV